MPTRRQALAAAVALPLAGAVEASAQGQGEAVQLARILQLEQIAVAAYATLAAAPRLRAEDRELLTGFRAHEDEHVAALGPMVEELGGRRPAAPAEGDVARVLPGLAGASSRTEVLEVAVELETAMVAAYFAVHQRLQTARVLQLTAGIMGCQGQHLAVLRGALGRPMLDGAFEDGKT